METPKPILDYLLDEDFINFILNPTPALTDAWQRYFSKHPGDVEHAFQARIILLGEENSVNIPAEELIQMKHKLNKELLFSFN